jgi:hypothetical protein
MLVNCIISNKLFFQPVSGKGDGESSNEDRVEGETDKVDVENTTLTEDLIENMVNDEALNDLVAKQLDRGEGKW